VINPKHPAFRGNKDPGERSRVALHNHWLGTPASEKVVVIAPTGGPNGFMWVKRPGDDLQQLMRCLGVGLSDFRTDWTRVFVDLSGPALRVACEQTMMFAGFILRDREGQLGLPIPEEELFMLENLNGTPFLYIADESHWEKAGKPLSEKLAEYYKKAGKPENLVVIKAKRDGNGALKGDPAVIEKFLATHQRPAARETFTWRFFSSDMVNPIPVILGLAMYDYDVNQPLEKTAGTIKYKASMENEVVKDKDGNETKVFYNLIDLQITEAEAITLLFYDGMVDLGKPVTIRINGKVIADKVVIQRDWNRFVSDVLPLRFFMIPVVGSINCEFEHQPQFVAPPKKDEAPAGGEKEAGAANSTDSSGK
jgi:hypothetical protein